MPKIAVLSQIVWSMDSTTKKSEAMMNSFEMVTTDDFKNTGYIYPINTGSSAKMSGRTDNTGTRSEKRPLSQASWTELTKEILSLPDTYGAILDELGECFIDNHNLRKLDRVQPREPIHLLPGIGNVHPVDDGRLLRSQVP